MKVHQVLRNDLQALEAVRPPDADRTSPCLPFLQTFPLALHVN